MPFKVQNPVGERFNLDVTDARYHIEDPDHTYVTIREATQTEDKMRSKLFAEYNRIYDLKQPDIVRIQQILSNDTLVEEDIYLTLCDSNICDDDGATPLFRFKTEGSITKLDMKRDEFTKAIGRIPSWVVDEIHEKVLLKNPDWGGPSGESN